MTYTFRQRCLSIIRKSLKDFPPSAPLDDEMQLQADLGLDSIGLVGLIFQLEEEFGSCSVEVDLAAMFSNVRSLGDLLAAARSAFPVPSLQE